MPLPKKYNRMTYGVKMKKILIVFSLIISLAFGSQIADAVDYSKVSTNVKIVNALNALEGINRRDVISILKGNNATRKPIRVMFRDLSVYGFEDSEALTARTKSGGLVIYINQEHRGASSECIACLIAHEAQHHTLTNTKAEELRAWISETQAWTEFTKRDKTLAIRNEPLVKRENYIARVKSKGGVAGVRSLIASNPVYAGLN